MNNFDPIRFGKYLLLERIAAGGMAELYRGKIVGVKGFQKQVAIKKLLPHLAEDRSLVEMFIGEAKLAALLTHQNIVQIYDLGCLEGTYFIAMEYLHGQDLRRILDVGKEKGRTLPLVLALHVASRVCAGLDYAHNLQDFEGRPLHIIHRDISPQNIIITYQGEVKIVDFGIAKAADSRVETRQGLIKGKLPYMSPEQAQGKKIDHRSDIFSVGIILYEMITGKRLYEGSELQIIDRVRNAEFEPPESVHPDLPGKLYEVLHRALAKDLELRYQSGAEMLAGLEECLDQVSERPSAEQLAAYLREVLPDKDQAPPMESFEVGGTAFPPGAADKETTLVQDQAIPPAGRDLNRVRSWLRFSRAWLALAAAGVIALAIAISWLLSGSGPEVRQALPPPAGEGQESTIRAASERSLGTELARAAIAALRQGRYLDAVREFEGILSAQPHLRASLAPEYAKALRGQATAIAKTDPTEAEALLHRALEVAPADPETYFALGNLYIDSKNYPKAIAAYRKSLQLRPRNAKTLFNLGYAYTVSKDYQQAEKSFQQVAELAPPYLDEALFNLAMVQKIQGKKEACIRNLKRALEVNPKNVKARKHLQLLTQKK